MSYSERAISVAGVRLWRWSGGPAPEPGLILTDGCLDLLWDGARLFVAGPDTTADQTVDLDDLWPAGDSRGLAERMASDPAELGRWRVQRAASRSVDPIGVPVFAMASAGVPVAVMADRLGISSRQLRRRCLPVFGYGPLLLARVLRLADQAHFSREVRALASTTPTTLLAELGAR